MDSEFQHRIWLVNELGFMGGSAFAQVGWKEPGDCL